ncbi:Ent-kaurene oxidase [Diaporthe amygdali]|uniref:Ent-kaurene oxidase n=1 Tax=Phomopsis amygdali TaxID=1214568 RepID=UPI0022FE1505|nr:Ent-kaurene oxidase [Diaporthe amygdali]KAJ0108710.1 Ent-kaurene oxidase [Diaporthe amygdali]
MMDQLPGLLADRLVLAASMLVILASVWLFSNFFDYSNKLPLLGREYGNSEKRRKAYLAGAARLYEKGHNLFKTKPYRLTTMDGERIVVPLSVLDELRRLPEDQLSIAESLQRVTETRYTGVTAEWTLLAHIIRSDLTQSLNRLLPKMAEEVDRTVKEVIGPCDDWTSEVVYQQLLKIIAIVSGSVFLGPDLCRRNEYLHASIKYTVDAFRGIGKLKKWHELLRPIGQFFTSELKTIAEHRRKAREFLIPVIRERKAAMEAGRELPDDLLQWMMNKADKLKISETQLADEQLSVSMAAIHTTTNAANDTLCELIIRPALMREVRDEIIRVLSDNGGIFTPHALFELKLLDSVLRETQRFNGSGKIRFPRWVKKPITLKDGTYIPRGYFIEAPYTAIVSDPELYPDSEVFDPYRFLNLRNGKTEDKINYSSREQYQFVNVAKENMGFGFGRHACPGRFFAAAELKLILANIILHYDLRMPNGATGGYQNSGSGGRLSKDPENQMEFKRVPGNEENP